MRLGWYKVSEFLKRPMECFMILRLVSLIACLFLAVPVQAGEESEYLMPTGPDMIRTLVYFNALDTQDDFLIDDYAKITDCDLYKNFYSDDFKWNKVRAAIRESLQKNKETYPTHYLAHTQVRFDRYDFETGIFRFVPDSVIRNVNVLLLYESKYPACNKSPVDYLLFKYRAVLNEPIFVDGLPLDEKNARALLELMKKDGNTARNAYVRFYVRILRVKPLRVSVKGRGGNSAREYGQSEKSGKTVYLNARLDKIEFYEDPAMKKLIYTYTYP